MSVVGKEYMDLVLLIRRTTKIESILESLGGSGGGIWEKADSISQQLPDNFMKKIIKIGIVRNDAVHGDLQVKDINGVVKQCDEILGILESKKKLEKLKKDIKSKLKKFHYFDKDNEILLDEDLLKWIDTVNTFNMKNVNNFHKLQEVLNQEEIRLKEIKVYAKKYTWNKSVKILTTILGLSIMVGVMYILSRTFK